MSQKVFAVIGVLAVMLIIAIGVFVQSQNTDEFDYANENAPQLIEDREQWSSIEWLTPVTIHVDQAEAVFYWQKTGEFSWKCKNKDGIDQGPSGAMIIRHNSCLFYLPLQESTIRVNQSSVVLVRPQAAISVDVIQSKLRIAENRQKFQYDLVSKHSDVESFESDDSAEVTISIAAKESTVSAY